MARTLMARAGCSFASTRRNVPNCKLYSVDLQELRSTSLFALNSNPEPELPKGRSSTDPETRDFI